MQVCISLQTDNHASNPPLSFFTGRMPFLLPNQQHQSTPTRHTTLVDCAVPVAVARAWNDLPSMITASSSLLMFRQQLKTFLSLNNILLTL